MDSADQSFAGIYSDAGDLNLKRTLARHSVSFPPGSKWLRTALADAMALGLPELEIRRMAKLPEWQVADLVAVPETTKPKRGR